MKNDISARYSDVRRHDGVELRHAVLDDNRELERFISEDSAKLAALTLNAIETMRTQLEEGYKARLRAQADVVIAHMESAIKVAETWEGPAYIPMKTALDNLRVLLEG